MKISITRIFPFTDTGYFTFALRDMEIRVQSTEERPFEDASRFETEAMPHFLALRRFALHLVRNRAEAEDLVQETFAQALSSFSRYKAGTNCRAWMCKIMFNKRRQSIRANSRYLPLVDDKAQEQNLLMAVATRPSLPHDFVGEKLSRSLAMLPKKYRDVIWLTEVEEFTYRETSGRLGIPIGTVMSRLHRGRKQLRRNFDLNASDIKS